MVIQSKKYVTKRIYKFTTYNCNIQPAKSGMNSREICVRMRKNRNVNKLDGAWDDKMAAIEFCPEFRKYFCYISLFRISFFKKNKTLNAKIENEC